MNPRLNISEVVKSFPGKVVGTHGKPVYNLFTPFDVALRENQLRAVLAELDLGPAIPAHYFVYALGEPAAREQTKIGGLPYRPQGLAWPLDADGKAKEFICQVNFSDDRLQMPQLPGDVMLLFTSEEGLDDETFKLEWYPSGMSDLIQIKDLPEFDFMFPKVREVVHCHRYETIDYPEAKVRLKGTRFESWTTLGEPCGSKIAGHCEATPPSHRHVFTLESIRLSTRDPYPFVNLKKWKPNYKAHLFDALMIGDLGRIHIFQSADGKLTVTDVSH